MFNKPSKSAKPVSVKCRAELASVKAALELAFGNASRSLLFSPKLAFHFKVCAWGKDEYLGHFASVGRPSTLKIRCSWSTSLVPESKRKKKMDDETEVYQGGW